MMKGETLTTKQMGMLSCSLNDAVNIYDYKKLSLFLTKYYAMKLYGGVDLGTSWR
jgi:hypothetical protein